MSEIKEAVQAQFGSVAANYKTSQVHAAGEDLKTLTHLAAQYPGAAILDVGCGAGHAAVAVAGSAREVVAFDLTAGMLTQVSQLAEERGITNIRTQQGDVENLPFEDAAFDLVITRLSAHHWVNPLKAVQECRRVLKPGGRFLLSDMVSVDDFAADTFLQAIELLRDRSHVRDHSTAQWLTMLAQAGFTGQVNSTWGIPLDFGSWVARMATPSAKVAMLQTLFDEAPDTVRETFQIKPDYHFTLPSALIEGE